MTDHQGKVVRLDSMNKEAVLWITISHSFRITTKETGIKCGGYCGILLR